MYRFFMRYFCPFNSELYVSGLTNIGEQERHKSGRFAILRRPITNSPFYDGMGTWPYHWVDGPNDIKALCEDFRHFVTVTVVTQPGYVPNGIDANAILLKQHFIFNPMLPPPLLSPRACVRLRRCMEISDFNIVTDDSRHLRMASLYERLKIRRGLSGSYVDFPLKHFKSISELSNGVFFEVSSSSGVGAMACGVLFGGMLQILHTACSDEGLFWNASYHLM